MLDTTSDEGGVQAVKGRFERGEGAWVERALGRAGAEHSLLLMHHWPWPVAFDVEGFLEEQPWPIRRLVQGAASLLEDVDELVEPGFPNHESVRRFIRRAGFSAVLCGHVHLFDAGPRDADFDGRVGRVSVHCMGRSGGVHQGPHPVLAYHLVEVGARGLKVRTRYLET